MCDPLTSRVMYVVHLFITIAVETDHYLLLTVFVTEMGNRNMIMEVKETKMELWSG